MEPFSVNLPPVTELPPSTIPPTYLPQTTTFAPSPSSPYPSITNPGQTHPTYTEMITAAITALKEPNGSSKKAIAKYIETVFSNLPGNHSALLTHHLKRLKTMGELVMVKHSYMLSRSVPFSSAAASPPPPPVTQANGVAGYVLPVSPGTKRGPGRPPKAKIDAQTNGSQSVGTEQVFASLGLDDGPSSVTKRGPGRPPKQKTPEAGGVNPIPTTAPLQIEPLGQWHPNQNQNQFTVASAPAPALGESLDPNALVVPEGTGRPKRKPGRPRRLGFAGSPVVARRPVKSTGRPRGRPRRIAVDAAEGGNLVSVGVSGLLGKRRGRKPKAAGIKKPRKLTGKPKGRPRKNAAPHGVFAAGTQQVVAYDNLKSKLDNFNASFAGIQAAATEQLEAYGNLKTKLEQFQSRVLETIGVVKPHLNQETALNALQELEALASTDLTAPPNAQSSYVPAQEAAPIN